VSLAGPAVSGSSYSDAMRGKGPGFVWDADTLDRYIADWQALWCARA
jgi:cytochrome c2